MKQFLLVILSVIIGLFSICCSSVTSRYPLPGNSLAIDQKKLEGIWLVDSDEVIHLRFNSKGTAIIAGMEWKEDQYEIVYGEINVTEGDEYNFLSIRFQEDNKWLDNYYFLTYTFTEKGDLILWLPNVDIFEEAIKNKQIKGIIEKDQYSTGITITNSSENLLKFINDASRHNLFDYKEPIVLYKIAN
jgi:hypothetical protein